jgi:hypothetical protein
MESYTKEFRDPVGSQSPKADLAAAFENLMDREVALEDEVATLSRRSAALPRLNPPN